MKGIGIIIPFTGSLKKHHSTNQTQDIYTTSFTIHVEPLSSACWDGAVGHAFFDSSGGMEASDIGDALGPRT